MRQPVCRFFIFSAPAVGVAGLQTGFLSCAFVGWPSHRGAERLRPAALERGTFLKSNLADLNARQAISQKLGSGCRASGLPTVARIFAALTLFRINTYGMPASVDSKPLKRTLSLLGATLTINIGGGGLIVNEQEALINHAHNQEPALRGRRPSTWKRARSVSAPTREMPIPKVRSGVRLK
jgi:hypothetical protein